MPIDLHRLYATRDAGELTFLWKVVDHTTRLRAEAAARARAQRG